MSYYIILEQKFYLAHNYFDLSMEAIQRGLNIKPDFAPLRGLEVKVIKAEMRKKFDDRLQYFLHIDRLSVQDLLLLNREKL